MVSNLPVVYFHATVKISVCSFQNTPLSVLRVRDKISCDHHIEPIFHYRGTCPLEIVLNEGNNVHTEQLPLGFYVPVARDR